MHSVNPHSLLIWPKFEFLTQGAIQQSTDLDGNLLILL